MKKRITQFQGFKVEYPKSKETKDTLAKVELKHKKPVIKIYKPKEMSTYKLHHEVGHIKLGHNLDRNHGPRLIQYWIDEIAADKYANRKMGRGELSLKRVITWLYYINKDINKYRKDGKKPTLGEFVKDLKSDYSVFGLTRSEFRKAYDWCEKNKIR
jgi:hypothetical protein